MKCLIVGCGYVGLPLGAELVRQGHEVFGLRRSAAAENELIAAGIQPLTGDVTKPETLVKLPHQFDWVGFTAEKIHLYQQHERLWAE
jgi:Trk K+ transport system NAD-binding subunit